MFQRLAASVFGMRIESPRFFLVLTFYGLRDNISAIWYSFAESGSGYSKSLLIV